MTLQPLVQALAATLVLLSSAATHAEQPDPNRVLVKFKPGAAAHAEAALQGAGGKVHRRLDKHRVISVTVPAQALQGLRNNPNIEYVEVDAPRYALAQTVPYGIAKVQAPETVAVGADGTGIKVCVIDSGINAAHEDFAGVALSGYPAGWNNDTCGHGTHVAGTIAAASNDRGVVGVSPGKLSLHIVKYFDGPTCKRFSYVSNLIAAADECQRAGARVINMSLGGSLPSTTESNAFTNLYNQGVLSVAAAGNDGNTTMSYPASYAAVMSVAATDQNDAHASFSQYNTAVEVAAPGVGVYSTYPTRDADLLVNGATYAVNAITGTVQGSASDVLVDGGRCAAAGSWAGKVVLCERGDISFADKVANVTAGGGRAALIYNNVDGVLAATLGTGVTSTIPAVTLLQSDGLALRANALGQTANVTTVPQTNVSEYAYLDGTSMATPHVAGVAALVWSAKPGATSQQVRDALTSTARDLGTPGRDVEFGYGLVQAFDAAEKLLGGAGGTPPAAPAGLTGTSNGTVKGRLQVGLAWSGGGAAVDVYRDNAKVGTGVNNTGSYLDAIKIKGRGTLTYKVCNAGTATCSGNASVSY
ncbi:S8 family serine peptidase [Aerolutibacter ruishenii]|uniref:PA domain-containing protein n=1 Tax=Aerolutibacter ruishenii TaxID=686800 RepID=A0A562M3G4_9GAMM|nr:S8 family serine peptidase [Lysobacter ruishenii]TWI14410.1 PA domain-containing protein [Lysobacter ruishenii]